MGDDYMVLRTACHISPCVRKTKYNPPHTAHMVHDIVSYIENAHRQPVFPQQFIALEVMKSEGNARKFSTNEVTAHFEIGETRNFYKGNPIELKRNSDTCEGEQMEIKW